MPRMTRKERDWHRSVSAWELLNLLSRRPHFSDRKYRLFVSSLLRYF
jgi:hypothetical protein